MKYKVLYAEDEPFLASIVSDGLKSSGYEVLQAADGEVALDLYNSGKPDICLLDIMMPLKNGYTLAEDIRKLDPAIPIIFLSAKALGEDVVKGFKSGGNDYLKKPFSMDELLVRIESLLIRFGKRRDEPGEQSIYEFGDCRLDMVNQQLQTPAGRFDLSFKEAVLLQLLIINKNTVLERREPLIKIWGDDSHYNSRSMDVFMAHIRKMLKDETSIQIMSIRGVGYKLIC